MKSRRVLSNLAVLACCLVVLILLPACSKGAKPAAAPAAKSAAQAMTNVVASTNVSAEYVSYFDDSLPPGNKGRDPFNPDSNSRYPAAAVPQPSVGSVVEAPQLKLYSVTGPPWLAAINNQILAVTDQPTHVRVPGGTVLVKVVRIGADYADVTINGGSIQRLTIGQKSPSSHAP
jgi:hypothetical protein